MSRKAQREAGVLLRMETSIPLNATSTCAVDASRSAGPMRGAGPTMRRSSARADVVLSPSPSRRQEMSARVTDGAKGRERVCPEPLSAESGRLRLAPGPALPGFVSS
jgi:hypothetical protein